MKRFLLLAYSLLLVNYLSAQQQLTEFSNRSSDKGSTPSAFIDFNGKLLFTAFNESYGRELWISDGTIDNAQLLKDIYPGHSSGITSSLKQNSVILNNTFYFTAANGTSNGEIWKTDGTPEGTVQVTNTLNQYVDQLTLVDDHFFFLKKTGSYLQVWKSDGTESGQLLVADSIPFVNKIPYQGSCNHLFFFTIQANTSEESKVWRSDGTAEGTFPLTPSIDGNGAGPGGSISLTQYIAYNNELYFVARSYDIFGSKSVGIMKTDGTVANTVPVKALYDGNQDLMEYADVILLNSQLYFSFFDLEKYRFFIWTSDGTEVGTKKIYDRIGSAFAPISNLACQDSLLIFCDGNSTGGTSLYTLNTNNQDLSEIKKLRDSSQSPFIFVQDYYTSRIIPAMNGQFLLNVPHDRYYQNSWFFNPSTNNVTAATFLDDTRETAFLIGSLYFSKSSDDTGYELWTSDGTEANTYQLDNINTFFYGLQFTQSITLNNHLIFTADDGKTGLELYQYNNDNDQTSLIEDIKKGPSTSYPNDFVICNNEAYFLADDSVHGDELWKTDGTTEGTQLVHDLAEGTDSYYPAYLRVLNNEVIFTIYKDSHYHLVKTDGTNFVDLKDLGVNSYNVAVSVEEMVATDNIVYFKVVGEGENLWRSDGTNLGTYKIKDLRYLSDLTPLNGRLFFNAGEAGGEQELWISDGTEQGTHMVKNIGDGYSSTPVNLIGFNNQVFFTAYTKNEGREIWHSDGTETGTQLLADIEHGTPGAITQPDFCVAGGKLFFSANDGKNGFELWKTDGSESGTVMVKDIYQGQNSSLPNQLTTVNDKLYFQAYDPEHGSELWMSDGTAEGTKLAADILPGSESSTPTDIKSIDNTVFFMAETANNGRQFWKMPYDVAQAVPTLLANDDLSVFPNPARDFIQISSTDEVNKVSIYNMSGQLVQELHLNRENRIDIHTLPPGLYMVTANINGTRKMRKFIKR